MKKILQNTKFSLPLVIILSFLLLMGAKQIIASRELGQTDYTYTDEYVRSRVTDIFMEDEVTTQLGGAEVIEKVIYFHALVLEGEYKGQTVLARQSFDQTSMSSACTAQPGDKIFLTVYPDEDGKLMGYAADYVREFPLMILVGGFLVLLILFGKMQGVKTVVSLVYTCLAVFAVFIPAILKGFDPSLTAIFISAYIIVMTLLIIGGFNFKSYSAGLGCLGGIIVAGSLAWIMESVMNISGLIDEDAAMLLFATGNYTLDLSGIVFASIIIGALGAVMDVAISIASALTELTNKAPNLSFKEIVKSGLVIGRDMMGTMANTLILAYAGGSLHVVLLLTAYQSSFSQMINREMIAVEVLRAISGSIGILFTIPITAIITAFLYKVSYKKKKELANKIESMP